MERCDVLIVGGGPAGSSCAWRLRRAGLDVIVLDRRQFPRDKVCAGWITPQTFEALALDPIDYAKDHVLQPIRGFRVGRFGDRPARIDYGRVVSWAIRRCELDAFLVVRSGARLHLGEPARSIRREGRSWIVNDAFAADLLVGAGGHFCPVAQQLTGEAAKPSCVIAAQEAEYLLEGADTTRCPVEPEIPELYFTPDLAGYGWIVRKGDWLNVGLGRQGGGNLADQMARFGEMLRAEGRLPAALPTRPRGHAYLLYGESPRPTGERGVLLVGDAAGLAYPRSGEGIRPAIESGLLAAAAILDGRAGEDPLLRYQTALRARFGSPATPAAGPLARLSHAVKVALAGRLLGSALFVRHIVLDRWFLHRQVPALTV